MKSLKILRINSEGFSHVEAVLAIVVIAAIAAVGARVLLASHAATPNYMLYSYGSQTKSLVSSDALGNKTPITIANKKLIFYGQYTWASNDSKIYFVGNLPTSSASSIYTMDYNGKTVKKLALKPKIQVSNMYNLVWNDTGQKILFIDNENSAAGFIQTIHTANADGSSHKVVYTLPPTGSEQISEAQWSPDGSKILIQMVNMPNTTSSTGKVNRLIVMNADGTNQTILPTDNINSPYYNAESSNGSFLNLSATNSWSPDSKTIVYGDYTKNGYSVLTINADGTGIYDIHDLNDNSGSNYIGVGPTWSKTGNYIVDLRADSSTGKWIFYADTLSMQLRTVYSATLISSRLLDGPVNNFAISPDGNNIAVNTQTTKSSYNELVVYSTTSSSSAGSLIDNEQYLTGPIW